MTKSMLTIPLAALMLSGCTGLSGLWLFEFQAPGLDNEVCTESVDHNFTGATVKSDDGTGTYTSTRTTETSSSLSFVRFEDYGDGTGTLVTGNAVYPGADQGEGRWVFEWYGFENSTQVDAHELGYGYTQDTANELTSTISLSFDGDAASGDVQEHAISDRSYTESDEWGKEEMQTIGDRGQIPAGTYLEIIQEDRTLPVTNSWDELDCDSADCALNLAADCTTTWAATGRFTSFGEEEYDALQIAGQQPGI